MSKTTEADVCKSDFGKIVQTFIVNVLDDGIVATMFFAAPVLIVMIVAITIGTYGPDVEVSCPDGSSYYAHLPSGMDSKERRELIEALSIPVQCTGVG